MGVALVLVLGLVLVAGAWLTFLAQKIETQLGASRVLMSQLQTELTSGDIGAAKSTLGTLQKHTVEARKAAADPLWTVAGSLPVAGANFAAVSEITASAEDVVNLGLSPLIENFDSLDWEKLAPVDGQVDVASLERLAPRLSLAASAVQLSHERLSGIEQSGLLPQIAHPLQEVTSELGTAKDVLNGATAAAKVLPLMLGTDRPRHHLLLIQNSAEIRATGGIPGALALIRANKGQIELPAQGSATAMGEFDPAVVIDEEQTAIYSMRMGRFMQSVNLTPDFPTAAQTAAIMWQERHEGASIDGVVALDPVALSHILRATGPVDLTFENREKDALLDLSGLPKSLSADNVVPTLLSDVYAAIEEPALQDEYFAAVAAEVFDALTSGKSDSAELIQSLIQSAEEGRLYVWSADTEEQAVIASTDLAGAVTGSASGGAAFGVYFNDGTGAKMDYYIRRTAQLQSKCVDEGYLQYTLVSTLTNTAPADAATSLPRYVTGGGEFGVPPGAVQTNIVGYGPKWSQLQTARVNGEVLPVGSYLHGDRPVGMLTTSLAPGQSATIEFDFTDVVQTSDPVLDVTPTIQPTSDVKLPFQSGPACRS